MLSRWSIYWVDIEGGNEMRITPAGRDFFTPAAFHTGDRRVAMAFQDANKIRCRATHSAGLFYRNGHTRLDSLQLAVSAELPSTDRRVVARNIVGASKIRHSRMHMPSPHGPYKPPLLAATSLASSLQQVLERSDFCLDFHKLVQADSRPVQWSHSVKG